MPITVAIVEDDTRLRDTVAMIINKSSDFRCVGSYRTGEEALCRIPSNPPKIVLMDVDLPGMTGVECVRQLKAMDLELQIIMLTVYKDTNSIFDALAAGAVGYLLKPVRAAQLLEALRDVYAGGSPMTGSIARKIVQTFQGSASASKETEMLSPRELEVLDYLSKGFLYKEIADQMGVSYATIRTYVERIYQKLHVRSRSQAVSRYLKQEDDNT